jgi:uncharacterized SAM-binding protein YcdF (DUF218 family)
MWRLANTSNVSTSRGRNPTFRTTDRRSNCYRVILVLMCVLTLPCIYLLSDEPNRIGEPLVRILEQRFQRVDIVHPQTLTGLIVLTGGQMRLSEAGRLARCYAHLKIVISGARGMPSVLTDFGEGIERSRIVLETRSRNTYENALYSAELIRPKLGEHWLLVTGASHMPRAIGAFRAVGLEVEPWPVYDLTSYDAQLAKVAFHEWSGLFVYWLMGRTSVLFPGPILKADMEAAAAVSSSAPPRVP